MDIVTTCPQCQFEMRLPSEAARQTQVCPRCDHVFVVPDAETPSNAPIATAPARARRPRSREASVLLAALLAIPPTVLVYAICKFGPRESQFIQIILTGRWVNVVSVYFASWAAMLLVLKRIGFGRQRRALRSDLVPVELGESISHANAGQFAEHARELDARLPGTFAIRRLQKLVRSYQSGRSPQDVASSMRAFADADAQAVELSYVFLKVLIWAIPIMGFIGTVLGIGESVHGFSDTMQGAQQLEVIRTSLGNVTTGLAVAFNTTLVALVLSLLVMFPMSVLQRAEERLIGDIDDYLEEHFLRRLQSESAEQNRGLELFRQSLADQASARETELSELRAGLDAAVRDMGQRVLDAWTHVDERLERRERLSQDRAQTLVAAFESSSRALFDEFTANAGARTAEAERLIDGLGAVGQRIEADAAKTYGAQSDLARQALIDAQQVIVALRDRDRAEHQEIAGALERSARDLERVGSELARESTVSAAAIGELVGDISQKLLAEAQQAIASLRERDRDDYREIVRSLQASAQEMERATAALAREASGSTSQIVSIVGEQSRKAALEAQQTVSSLRERDRDEQKEIARTVQRAAQEMERASAALAKETSSSNAQITALFRQMNVGLEGQAKTLVAGMASQLERQTRELGALQRGLADGLTSFQASLRTLEAEMGAAMRDARERIERQEQRAESDAAEAWATAQKTFEASARAFAQHAESSTASLRQIVDTQQALVAAVSTQFSSALEQHRQATEKNGQRDLGAVVQECQNIVAALSRASDALEKKSAEAPRSRDADSPIEPPDRPERVTRVEPVDRIDPPSDGDGTPSERPRPAQSPRAELPRKALQPRTSKPKPTPAPPAPPAPPANGAPARKSDRSGFWRRFWLGN